MAIACTLETFFLSISTLPNQYFWCPSLIACFLNIQQQEYVDSKCSSEVLFSFALKCFVLRCTLVLAILAHEVAHLIAAAVLGHDPLHSLFSARNVFGNADVEYLLKALCPFTAWPSLQPYVEISASVSSSSRRWIMSAGPVMSIIIACICTFSILGSRYSEMQTVAVGTWLVALGGVASDILDVSSNSSRFYCGNFGMLIICAMDRLVDIINRAIWKHLVHDA